MYKFISLFGSTSAKTTDTAPNVVKGVNNDVTSMIPNHSKKMERTVNDSLLIQSIRQQRQRKLEEATLLRRIAHQSFMNQYEQDHLPLSSVMEKLEEDNLPLIQLQQKLKQRKDDDSTIYTTTKENLKSLFYDRRHSYSFLIKSRPILANLGGHNKKKNDDDRKDDENISSPDSEVKDERDYDVWDDAVIGRIMNIIDTYGIEPYEMLQGASNTTTNDQNNGKKPFIFSDTPSGNMAGKVEKVKKVVESKDISIERGATIVAKNFREDCRGASTKVTDETINYDETMDLDEEEHVRFSNPSSKKKDKSITITTVTTITSTPSNKVFDDLIGDNSKSLPIEDDDGDSKRKSGFFGKRRSILSSSFINNKVKNLSEGSIRRKDSTLSRRSSIHSKKSYQNDNVSRNSSISSKFSINTTATMEDSNDNDNVKSRKRFSINPKKSGNTSKSNRILRKLWKSKYQQKDDGNQLEENSSDRELEQSIKLQQRQQHSNDNLVEGTITNENVGTNPRHSNPDYSNFYLAMPNDKWMVRTRTASRKITGTQYVDKKCI